MVGVTVMLGLAYCGWLKMFVEVSSILSVGAGHEMVLYWLANHAQRVIATDMYEGVWRDKQA